MKIRREAGVGILIKIDPKIVIKEINILDPRLISVNLKIHGFNLKVINVYAPTEAGSESIKDSVYRLLDKCCKKNEKHQKLLITGDFNATTSLSLQKCCFDGNSVIANDECNDNGQRLKSFCYKQKLYVIYIL